MSGVLLFPDGNANDRPNLIATPALDPNRPRNAVSAAWFNTAAFARGALGTNGTAGRNIIENPGIKNLDLGIFRKFRVRELFTLQARGEFSNALNMVSLSGPTSVLTSPIFGQIRSARDMRQVQVGLRLTF